MKMKQQIDVEKAIKAYERHKDYMTRRRIKVLLLCRKAEAAGITVSDKEIDEYLKSQKKK
jgi:hypothetical protein